MAKTKNNILIKMFIGFLSLILLILLVKILLNVFEVKTFEINELKEQLITEFNYLNLTDMDHIDVLDKFGFEKSEVGDALYLKSLVVDGEGNDITENHNYIIIMNTDNYQYYYDIFESHFDSNIRFSEDDKILELYNNSIIKCDKNYVYMIISNEAENIEKLLLK